MLFHKLAEYLEKLEKTASRNEMTEILADLLRVSTDSEISKVCYLLGGRVLPQYAGVEFNFAEKMMKWKWMTIPGIWSRTRRK